MKEQVSENKKQRLGWIGVIVAIFFPLSLLWSCTTYSFSKIPDAANTPYHTPSLFLPVSTIGIIEESIWDQKAEEYPFVTIVDVNQNLQTINLQTGEQTWYDLSKYSSNFGFLLSILRNALPCGYLGLFEDRGEHRILQFSPNKTEAVEIFRLIQNATNSRRWNPQISPDQQYVIYVVFSGFLGYDWAEFQNVELIHLDGIEKPVQLSSRGGTWKGGGRWSPDGSRIAFTDYDQDGFLQVFVTSLPELETQQISHFMNPKLKPASLQWSPDGDKILVVFQNQQPIEESEVSHTEAWIFYPDDGKSQKLPLPSTNLRIGDEITWSKNGRVVLLIMTSRDENNQIVSSFHWFDIQKNWEVLQVTEKEIAEMVDGAWSGVSGFFPLMSDLSEIGLIGGSNQGLYRLEAKTKKIEPIRWVQFAELLLISDVRVFKKEVPLCED
ncbi:MAG: hypothetical protein AB1522_04500 [Chloroflexota bacterium]